MTYGVNSGLIHANPLSGIRSVFKKPKKKNMAALPPDELSELMVAIANASIKRTTRCLIEWQLHTMTRPAEAATTRWADIDFVKKIWTIPAERMKKRRTHIIPLTEQALALLEAIKPVCLAKKVKGLAVAQCPRCFTKLTDDEGNYRTVEQIQLDERRQSCPHCGERLWTLMRPGKPEGSSRRSVILKSMCRIPTIGPVKAEQLVGQFGEEFLASMLADNVHEFINLMDRDGNFVFSDKQAKRMERAMANIEFGLGEGGYQPTEFIKRYLPDHTFDLLIVDEGHEYKNAGTAQGQAMGVLAAKARKTLLLTGTLMGGYDDDLFYLLFRILSRRMIEDGYRPNERGSLAPAAMAFMREHGVLKDIYTEKDSRSHKTARGKAVSVRSVKAPGFGPKGILRYVLPFTVFLKLKDIGGNVLPPYDEEFVEVDTLLGNQDDSKSGTAVFGSTGSGQFASSTVTGNQAMQQILSSGVSDISDWVNKLYGEAFAAIYVQPNAKVAIHIDQELQIDYEIKGRKVRYAMGATHASTLD